MNTKILQPSKKNLTLAAAELKSGGLVAFATETVYGLGANAFDADAVKQIFVAKGRPSDNPLIVHLAYKKDIEKIAFLTPLAKKAVQKFLPGALTLVLKKRDCIPFEVSGGLDTVAVRIPSSKSAQKLLRQAKIPVAAPSANTSTRPSPTTAQHVLSDLGGKLKYIVDGGECSIGLESTIVDFCGKTPALLRLGGVTVEQLEQVLGHIDTPVFDGDRPLAPGMKYRHYAPDCQIILTQAGDVDALCDAYNAATSKGERVLVLALKHNNLRQGNPDFVLFDTVEQYANQVFALFRQAEQQGRQKIICQLAPALKLGNSLNNRLVKAAGGAV